MSNTVIYFSVLLLLTGWSCKSGAGSGAVTSDNTVESGIALLEFEKMEHDFGKITAGEKVGAIFKFLNNGDGDLLITSASTSCGCTVPKYSKEPIPPGGAGTVEVVFDSSGRSGQQTKTVTVMSNASKPVIILKISAEIEIK